MRAARSSDLERLHGELHAAFFYGQNKRQSLRDGYSSSLHSEFDPQAEVGSRCTIAPTWLEDALAGLAGEARQSAEGASELQLPAIPAVAQAAKDGFVGASSSVFEVWGGTVTFMDSGSREPDQLSPFEEFHHQLCGHVAALLVRSFKLQWEDADPEHRNLLRDVARQLGLAPVPSASTLKRALTRQLSPQARGSNRSVT